MKSYLRILFVLLPFLYQPLQAMGSGAPLHSQPTTPSTQPNENPPALQNPHLVPFLKAAVQNLERLYRHRREQGALAAVAHRNAEIRQQKTRIAIAFRELYKKQDDTFRRMQERLAVMNSKLSTAEQAVQNMQQHMIPPIEPKLDMAAKQNGASLAVSAMDISDKEDSFQIASDKSLEEQFLEAAYQGKIDNVKQLLTRGVNINTTDPKTGETALHKAT